MYLNWLILIGLYAILTFWQNDVNTACEMRNYWIASNNIILETKSIYLHPPGIQYWDINKSFLDDVFNDQGAQSTI